MKKLILLFFSSVLWINLIGQNTTEVYDSVLAKKFGADEYGMKAYIFVLLTPGVNHLVKGEKREAKELLQTDPAIQSKVLDAELYEWYGSAALNEYLKIQKKITRKQF